MSDSNPNDLQIKYQKLAAEYAKLKAQVPVLKKAYIDEQTKCEQLNDSLKQINLSVRKNEQEIDSLTFRNKQLESRVQSLQQELESSYSDKKHKRNASNATDLSNVKSVIDEELQNKIAENARLHKQMYEATQEYRQTVSDLQEHVSRLQREADKHTQLLDTVRRDAREQIDKLTTDRAALEIRLQKQETNLRQMSEKTEEAERKLIDVQKSLGKELEEAQNLIALKLPFIDIGDSSFNALNCPTHDRRYQQRIIDLLMATLLPAQTHWLQSIDNVFNCLADRYVLSVNSSYSVSAVNKQVNEQLLSLKTISDSLCEAYKTVVQSLHIDTLSLLETSSMLRPYSALIQRFCAILECLMSYICLSIEQEKNSTVLTQSQVTQSDNVQLSLKQFVSSLVRVADYISLVATQGNSHCSHLRSNYKRMLDGLQAALVSLGLCTSDLVKNFISKISLEQQLPTTTLQLRAASDKSLHAWASLGSTTDKLCHAVSAIVHHCLQGPASLSQSMEGILITSRFVPFVSLFQKRSAQYHLNIQQSRPECVPYETALSNQKILYSSTEGRDALVQQVASLQEQVRQLDQQKEHWRLECQLLQMKIDKLQTRPLSALNSSDAKLSISTNEVPPMLAKVETLSVIDSHEEGREDAIREHYSSKLLEITKQLQLSDSRILDMSAECHALHRHLKILAVERDHLKSELMSTNQRSVHLKDELETTGKSYEEQLSLMSEHLAAMNEKLSQQKDEIDALKYELSSKVAGTKKSKFSSR